MWWLAVAGALADDVRLVLADPTEVASPRDACRAAVCRTLRDLVDGADHTLDLAFYGFRRQTALFEAVRRAKARGVRVRLVVDRTVDGANYYADTEAWVRTFGARSDLAVDRAEAARRRSWTGTPRCPRPEG
ncbi:MAG: hypothetical protein AAF602_31125, partial [Myxococcota bacterium]